MTAKITDIYQALNAVMKEVGYVQKKRGGQGINYSYAGEAAFIKAIRPHMVTNGVIMHPAAVATLNQDSYTTKKGAVMNRTVVVMTYRFAHADSGTHIDVQVMGEGSDIGDKSANKALTGAYKYALRQTFLIETGDDPDKAPSEPQASNNGQQQEQAPPPAGTTPKLVPIKATTAKFKKYHALGKEVYGSKWDDVRAKQAEWISGQRAGKGLNGPVVKSSLELAPAEIGELIEGIEEKKANGNQDKLI